MTFGRFKKNHMLLLLVLFNSLEVPVFAKGIICRRFFIGPTSNDTEIVLLGPNTSGSYDLTKTIESASDSNTTVLMKDLDCEFDRLLATCRRAGTNEMSPILSVSNSVYTHLYANFEAKPPRHPWKGEPEELVQFGGQLPGGEHIHLTFPVRDPRPVLGGCETIQ